MTNNSESSEAELNRIRASVSTALMTQEPNSLETMAGQALAVVARPEIMDQIEQAVGEPIEGETREQYIQRGTDTIVAALTELLINRRDKPKP